MSLQAWRQFPSTMNDTKRNLQKRNPIRPQNCLELRPGSSTRLSIQWVNEQTRTECQMKPHHIQLQVSIIVATSGELSELENVQLDNIPVSQK